MARADHPFWIRLRADSALCDDYLSMLGEHLSLENNLDRVDDRHPLDYQRGKVAMLKTFESVATKIAHMRGTKE